ncbi:nuclear transport factor 2 family protein [Pseudonocardia spinosispora]|uniref:nuclear transport factor 2 family protein n=1 Tax=Pseudonocardia spinosispora TaxID=103441 RepID=UPI000420E70E|nr:nuclear transport factor 2 family protein [Pseudonocardia spinosispora]
MSTDLQNLAERYIDVWNETDPAARRSKIDELYSAEAGYTDPLVDARGVEAIDTTIAAVQQQFAGLVFSLAGPVDAHHNTARFQWNLGAPGAEEPLVVGFDVAVAENGKLAAVYGFLDKVPAS